MANGKTHNARRREVRRNVPRPGQTWLQQLRRREVAWATLFIAAIGLIGSFIALSLGNRIRHYPNQLVTDAIIARVDFNYIDQQLTKEKKNEARNRAPSVYVCNQPYYDELNDRLHNLLALGSLDSINQVPQDNISAKHLTKRALKRLREFDNEQSIPDWQIATREFLQGMFSVAVLDDERFNKEGDPNVDKIVIRHLNSNENEPVELLRYRGSFHRISEQSSMEAALEREATRFGSGLNDVIPKIVLEDLRPTYLYDHKRTDERSQTAFDQQPPVRIAYAKNQVIVPAGERLSLADLHKISDEQMAFAAQQSSMQRALARIGQSGLILLIGLAIWVYIFAFNPKIARNPMRGVALTALLLLCHVLAVSFSQLQPQWLFLSATFPTLLAAIVLTIVYDQRFAMGITIFHALLVMLSLKLPASFALIMLAGAGSAVALLREVRTRSTLVQVGLISGLAMGTATFLTSAAFRNLHIGGELGRIGFDTLWAMTSGLGTGVLVQAMLPTIEKIFKVSTAMTLRELNDASHPLLQQLAQESPGTYQHSLRIADMAEAAAEMIGADGLACRVGAMYHDVGKINKPAYFIENQGGGPNRHSKLSPAMSVLIIVGHVKDGIEMAREFGLPLVLRHFIESHHGTTLVEYFYHAAKKQMEAKAKKTPREFEYRYPGPKPQTKEAAIMLLCDSIEAAARTLAEPTPIRIEQLVHSMANKRLMDGQFDESNLTLQELHKIEQSIIKTLCAVYHRRVKYPTEHQSEPHSPPDPFQESGTHRSAAS